MMTKVDFLKRWAKKATSGGAAEAFERDVETLMRSTVRVSVAAVVSGVLEGAKLTKDADDRKLLENVARAIPKAVEGALRKLYE